VVSTDHELHSLATPYRLSRTKHCHETATVAHGDARAICTRMATDTAVLVAWRVWVAYATRGMCQSMHTRLMSESIGVARW
jgi:hypothetical protein